MNDYYFDAVIFDLDGVITKTALIHAKAWKLVFDEYLQMREKRNNESFREFTHESDYLTYVDGKPRYDGVKSFLESRGIKIPFGQPNDPPEKETICGIGNRKNSKFLEIIKTEGVQVYPSTIEFIKELRQSGIRTGIISSSKNCQYILQALGIENLFQTRVDGQVSVQQKIKGKPAPDIFLAAAGNLGAIPARTVIVEDAISGAQAGRDGGFGLVIGLARQDNESALVENGADVAMKDISAINFDWVKQWFKKRPVSLFEFWDKNAEIQNVCAPTKSKESRLVVNPYYSRSGKSVFFSEKKPVFFLDYDGTLTPIVERPELAILSEDMRNAVQLLSQSFTTAIISGRMREDVEKLVGIKGILYAGSHGFDILGKGVSLVEPRANQAISLITKITKQISKKLAGIPGLLIEEKKFSVAVHYRLVKEQQISKIRDCVGQVIGNNHSLRLMSGKKVFEILPNIDWDKGRAVRWVMQALGLSWSDVSVVYIGDDTTDEDAFRVVRTRGTGILVSAEPKESAADFQLSSTEQVKRLFDEIISPTVKK
ncbi:MAG: trehalose-phosphatase [Candidatus Omnitrophota bacterium]|jgi:alpha,alpha-trehalase